MGGKIAGSIVGGLVLFAILIVLGFRYVVRGGDRVVPAPVLPLAAPADIAQPQPEDPPPPFNGNNRPAGPNVRVVKEYQPG